MDNTTTERVHCLIIGSGPAGYTAAIYAARANLKPVLYQRYSTRRATYNNYRSRELPRLPRWYTGPSDMMVHFEKQAAKNGGPIYVTASQQKLISQNSHSVFG